MTSIAVVDYGMERCLNKGAMPPCISPRSDVGATTFDFDMEFSA